MRRPSIASLLLALLLGAASCTEDVPTTCTAWSPTGGVDLSGSWSVQADPEGTGEASGWASAPLPAPLTITVPGCLDTLALVPSDAEGPELHGYVGKSWWQTTFGGPSLAADERAWLVLDGVALRARVFVDGALVGEASQDHLRFQWDVTERVGAGLHRLAVEVDNTILERSIPDVEWNGWWNHTGLIRPVRLEVRPAVDLAALRMDTRLNASGSWHTTVTATVAGGSGQAGTLRLALLDEGADCETVFESVSGRTLPQGNGDLHVEVDLGQVTPWAPRAPHLYRLQGTLETDAGTATRTVRTAFRDVALDGPRVLWNGQPLVLRGVNRHELHPDKGLALDATAQRTDLEGILALGANVVRLAHYPQAQEVLDLCDELGLLAWVEIPAWHTDVKTLADDGVWTDQAEPFLTGMVEQYRHHPSVLFWGIGNEFGSHTSQGEAYCQRAASWVRELDSTRLVTFASDKHELLPLVQADRCFQFMDVVAVNEYYGWYYKGLDDLGPALDALHAAFPQKPVLVSEFGAEAIAGLADPAPPDVGWHGDGTFEFSEDFQLKLLASHLDQIADAARADWMLGAIVWVWADFADPHRVDDGRPEEEDFKNLKGVVTERREKKRAWTLLNGRWTE